MLPTQFTWVIFALFEVWRFNYPVFKLEEKNNEGRAKSRLKISRFLQGISTLERLGVIPRMIGYYSSVTRAQKTPHYLINFEVSSSRVMTRDSITPYLVAIIFSRFYQPISAAAVSIPDRSSMKSFLLARSTMSALIGW